MFIRLHIKYQLFLSDFIQIEFSRKSFEKYPHAKFHEYPFRGSRTVPRWRTEVQTWRRWQSLCSVLRTRLKTVHSFHTRPASRSVMSTHPIYIKPTSLIIKGKSWNTWNYIESHMKLLSVGTLGTSLLSLWIQQETLKLQNFSCKSAAADYVSRRVVPTVEMGSCSFTFVPFFGKHNDVKPKLVAAVWTL